MWIKLSHKDDEVSVSCFKIYQSFVKQSVGELHQNLLINCLKKLSILSICTQSVIVQLKCLYLVEKSWYIFIFAQNIDSGYTLNLNRPLEPHFIQRNLGVQGCTRVYIIFLILTIKHRMWILNRTASLMEFYQVLQSMFWATIRKINFFIHLTIAIFKALKITIYLIGAPVIIMCIHFAQFRRTWNRVYQSARIITLDSNTFSYITPIFRDRSLFKFQGEG